MYVYDYMSGLIYVCGQGYRRSWAVDLISLSPGAWGWGGEPGGDIQKSLDTTGFSAIC